MNSEIDDIFIIGGGINGCGIARDAAGRGLKVRLAEMNDLGSGTSSASTKLFHGGLRYLEYFEFRLVREALIEREILLSAMPHIAWPMRFVLPYHKEMRFESQTPASRLLARVMPWVAGRRPRWLIRLGLFLYDHLGGRKILPATSVLDLRATPEGAALQDKFSMAYEYSDCWVEDSRLVALNARDAAARGAVILPRHKVVSAARVDGIWQISTQTRDGQTHHHQARILINAAGPWVSDVIGQKIGQNSKGGVRLVRGSHIVTKRLYDHEKCYFFQGQDGRICFAIPYEQDFTLIGTTDQDHHDPDTRPECSAEERDYMLAFVNKYFSTAVTAEDIVWSYSGLRPLYDDGAQSASAATRDYTLILESEGDAPLLNIFGGKITTYRRLAESALAKIADFTKDANAPWTAGVALPGGDFAVGDVDRLIARLAADYPFLMPKWATRLIRAYGRDAWTLLGDAKTADDLGRDFGATLTACEIQWLMKHEFAQTAEDVVWRRSKLGLRLDPSQVAAIDDWMQSAAPQMAAE
ncbi:glycerol-3-phosphate dehydrogenase [Rhodobacteraceae bacterium XHP0102]|nr:glycerol-3-phosphate dehydrogenase [Rhodobacteraceae bacterium XHP0102]